MTFSRLRGRATPSGGPHPAGVTQPRAWAVRARVLAVVVVLAGFIAMLLAWPSEPGESLGTVVALGFLGSALMTAFWLSMAAAGLDWLAARYEQTEWQTASGE